MCFSSSWCASLALLLHLSQYGKALAFNAIKNFQHYWLDYIFFCLYIMQHRDFFICVLYISKSYNLYLEVSWTLLNKFILSSPLHSHGRFGTRRIPIWYSSIWSENEWVVSFLFVLHILSSLCICFSFETKGRKCYLLYNLVMLICGENSNGTGSKPTEMIFSLVMMKFMTVLMQWDFKRTFWGVSMHMVCSPLKRKL